MNCVPPPAASCCEQLLLFRSWAPRDTALLRSPHYASLHTRRVKPMRGDASVGTVVLMRRRSLLRPHRSPLTATCATRAAAAATAVAAAAPAPRRARVLRRLSGPRLSGALLSRPQDCTHFPGRGRWGGLHGRRDAACMRHACIIAQAAPRRAAASSGAGLRCSALWTPRTTRRVYAPMHASPACCMAMAMGHAGSRTTAVHVVQ
jgi:hypothetical protein